MRRFARIPQHMLDFFEELIRDSEYTIQKCCQMTGIRLGTRGRARAIINRYRVTMPGNKWLDIATGEIRPMECTITCAAEKVGVSRKTIRRRINAGLVRPAKSRLTPSRTVFLPSHIKTLEKIGKLKPGTHIIFDDEVRDIRRRYDSGETIREIHGVYPLVTPKQIRRIAQRIQRRDV